MVPTATARNLIRAGQEPAQILAFAARRRTGPIHLIRRSGSMSPDKAAFIKRLHRGDPLAAAAEHAAQVDEDFDLAVTFGRMLGLRLLAAGTPT